jgi:hypothetical protein
MTASRSAVGWADRWKSQYVTCCRDTDAVDTGAADHGDPVGRICASAQQGKCVVVQGYFACPAGERDSREQHLDLPREVGAGEVDRSMLSERRASIDSSLGACFGNEAAKHIESGVESDELVV